MQSERTTSRSPYKVGLALPARVSPHGVVAQDDQCRANGGGYQGDPANAVEAFAGKQGCGRASRTGREPTISDAWLTVVCSRPWNWMRNWTGIPKKEEISRMRISLPVKRTRLSSATGSKANAGKEKPVEHHVLYTHFIHGNASEVETSAPQAACDRACTITKKSGARSEGGDVGHGPLFTVAYGDLLAFLAGSQ